MGLALLSFLLSGTHHGAFDIVFALVIALAKTTLVALFFMELIEHRFINTMVVLVSAGLITLLLSLTVADIVTRHTFPRGPVPTTPQAATR